MAVKRLALDIVACDGRGICVEILPERIRLDDWGYPMIDAAPVTPDLARRAAQAVRYCPKLALRLVPVEASVQVR